jgi:predicted DNA-binding transcriptional regulator YafY
MGRAKSMNNSVLINVDQLHSAIAADTTVRFKYFHYNLKMERVYSRKGEVYEVSPWALLYDNDNYYLYAFVDGEFRNYRVDRMAAVEQGTSERQGKEAFEKKDMPAFSKSTFGMFNGQEERVEMVFHNRMMDVVIDKFGKEVWLEKVDEWHFKISVPVAVSPQFFAWVFGLGNYVTITGPEHVKQQMKEMLEEVHKRY